MSKYVIILEKNKPIYLGNGRTQKHCLFFHTNTKHEDNKPYWSLSFLKHYIKKYSIEKEMIPCLLKLAQNHKYNFNDKRTGKIGKIFVLKINSPKLKSIIESCK